MSLHETHILCEALTQFIESASEEMSAREREDMAIAERMLERYTEAICARLTSDYRARVQ